MNLQWFGAIFPLFHPSVGNLWETANGDYGTGWIGRIYWPEFGDDQVYRIGTYIDGALLLIFGGIPWQARIPNSIQMFNLP